MYSLWAYGLPSARSPRGKETNRAVVVVMMSEMVKDRVQARLELGRGCPEVAQSLGNGLNMNCKTQPLTLLHTAM